MGVTVYEDPKGSGIYYIRISHKGIRKSKKIGTSKDTADEVAKKIAAKLVLGELDILKTKPKEPTFSEIAHLWLHDYIKENKTPATFERYEGVLRMYVSPALGSKPMVKIRRSDVRNLLLKVGKTLSYSSVCLVRDVCSGVFHYAIDDEIINKSPLAGISKQLALEKKKKKQIGYFEPEEIEAFLGQCKKSHPANYPFFFCGFRTGMRLGELCGLKWGDINWVKRQIHVQRSYKRQKISDLKTTTSNRLVDMTAQLVDVLGHLHTKEKAIWLKDGKKSVANKYVFLNPRRVPFSQNTIRGIFKRILELAGLSARRVHDIRHTFASVLLSAGASLMYVKEQMGHSSIKITVDTYGNLIPGSQKESINALDNPLLLSSNPQAIRK